MKLFCRSWRCKTTMASTIMMMIMTNSDPSPA
jgi:hypothetical protein